MKKRSVVYLFFIVIVFVIALTMTSITTHAKEYSGSCGATGNHMNWHLDTVTKTLSITGIGNMANYTHSNSSNSPWYQYYKDIETVKIEDGVKTIGNYAFDGCSSIKTVVLPDSIKKIGIWAFHNCSSLLGITIPDGVTLINAGTFYNCSNLKDLRIGNGITEIGEDAFYNCSALKELSIPTSVLRINYFSFFSVHFEKIYINDISSWCNVVFTGPSYDHFNSVFFPSSSYWPINTNYLYINNVLIENLIIPEGIVSINDYTFSGCRNLKSVTFPDSIKKIGNYAFMQNTNLSKIVLPNNDTFIGKYAFYKCAKLADLIIPNGITDIGKYAFSNCSGLTSLIINGSVKTIGNSAFGECKNLSRVIIQNGVSVIDMLAFYNDWNLESITIPNSISIIDECAFAGCWNLSSVRYLGTMDEWKRIRIVTGNEPLVEANISVLINPYNDIQNKLWYTTGVLYCADKGYMSGTSTTQFSPNATLTRAMFVTILAKVDGADTSTYDAVVFKDVPAGKWFSKPIAWAADKGYAGGTGDGYFSPDAPVTRETLAQFFYTYSKTKGYDISKIADLSVYTDEGQIAGWAKTAVSWAVGSGLISGTSKTTVAPKATATRAQVAVLVMNYVEKIAG